MTSPASTRSTAPASSISSTTAAHHNSTIFTATNINSYINGNAQIAIPSLDITTTGRSEWFYVNVPVHDHGDDDRHGAVEQLELAVAKIPGLQPVTTSIEHGVGARFVRGDDQLVDERAAGQGYYVKVTAEAARPRSAAMGCCSTSAARRSRRYRRQIPSSPSNRTKAAEHSTIPRSLALPVSLSTAISAFSREYTPISALQRLGKPDDRLPVLSAALEPGDGTDGRRVRDNRERCHVGDQELQPPRSLSRSHRCHRLKPDDGWNFRTMSTFFRCGRFICPFIAFAVE